MGGEAWMLTPAYRVWYAGVQTMIIPSRVLGTALLFTLLGACLSSCTTGGFAPLLTPGSFAGWHTAPGGEWHWEGDVLVGTSPKSERRHGLLISDVRYRDFEARFEFRTISGCSGFYFRVDEVRGATGVNGFQAEVDPSMETGGLYETGGRAWVVKPDPEVMKNIYRSCEWNRMSVRASGANIDVHVNGQLTASLRDDPGRREGHFALQLHGNQDLRVEYRNLQLRELSNE